MTESVALNSPPNLKFKLQQIKKVFDTENVIRIHSDNQAIAKYYRINKIPYSLFHRGNDFIHMAVSRDGVYKKDDLLEPALLVGKYIKELSAKRVLELATGRGANSAYLAGKFPSAHFTALDLPGGQISYAEKKAKKFKNFKVMESDYHNLQIFPLSSFDLVFIIEALCYSVKKDIVLKEVKRVLKKSGIFIIADGYLIKPISDLTKEELLAKKLIEKGMMVENFENYNDFKRKIKNEGFEIIFEEDVSKFIVPNLRKFERQASKLFSLPSVLARSIIKFLPSEFTNNALSGYLMRDFVERGLANYTFLVLAKQ